jgi:hypothetical protein
MDNGKMAVVWTMLPIPFCFKKKGKVGEKSGHFLQVWILYLSLPDSNTHHSAGNIG